jgi:hypothetical protein
VASKAGFHGTHVGRGSDVERAAAWALTLCGGDSGLKLLQEHPSSGGGGSGRTQSIVSDLSAFFFNTAPSKKKKAIGSRKRNRVSFDLLFIKRLDCWWKGGRL